MDESAVKEIARMQSLIDEYEQVIKSLWATATTGKEYNPIKLRHTEFDNEISFLIKFVGEKAVHDNSEKREIENAINNGFREIMRDIKANERRLLADANKNGLI